MHGGRSARTEAHSIAPADDEVKQTIQSAKEATRTDRAPHGPGSCPHRDDSCVATASGYPTQ